MGTYQDLTVWQESIELVAIVYAITETFPDTEKFGITNQMRRCAVSIPSNIAEGHARKSDGDFVRFLRISYGSSAELETQLLIAKRLKFISSTDFAKVEKQLISVKKMLNKLMSSLTKD